MSSSEQRQLQLKELLKRQKKPGNVMLSNYEFSKEIHYKSPFEQADSAQLPTMYTVISIKRKYFILNVNKKDDCVITRYTFANIL